MYDIFFDNLSDEVKKCRNMLYNNLKNKHNSNKLSDEHIVQHFKKFYQQISIILSKIICKINNTKHSEVYDDCQYQWFSLIEDLKRTTDKDVKKLTDDMQFLHYEAFKHEEGDYLFYDYHYEESIFCIEDSIIQLRKHFNIDDEYFTQLCEIYSAMCILLYDNCIK